MDAKNKKMNTVYRCVVGLLTIGIGLVAGTAGLSQKVPADAEKAQRQIPEQVKTSDPRQPVRLKVPFLVRQGKGFLALVRDPTGKLSESAVRSAWPQLYLMTEQPPEANKPIKPIQTLKDLQGEVALRSPTEALSFVRLRTSPGANFLLAEPAYPTEVEIISVSDVDAAFWFGTREGGFPFPLSGFMGIVSPTDATQMKLPPAVCQESQNRFVIIRTMLVKEKTENPMDDILFPARYHADRIVEEVGKNGSYRITKRETVTLPQFDDVNWTLPELGPTKPQPNAGVRQAPTKLTAKKLPVRTNSIGMKLVQLPRGTFLMGWKGSPEAEPIHKVTVSSFWIGQYEVTNTQFEQFKKRARRPAESAGDNSPVTRVSFDEAHDFCEWLNKKEKALGRRYRLPTEAEWEYAARGGLVQKQYPWGDDNWLLPGGKRRATFGLTEATPVGTYAPNGFGLYDMAGNVEEWVSDWFDRGYYARSPAVDPKGPKKPLPVDYYQPRIARGGRFHLLQGEVGLRSAKTLDPEFLPNPATFGDPLEADGSGFRVVCEAATMKATVYPALKK